MTLTIGTPRSLYPDDVSVATDPLGANIDPWTTEDQTDRLQWWADSVAKRPLQGKPPAGYLPPCRIRKSDQILMDPTSGHRSLTFWGAGGDASVIIDTVDAGDGKYTLAKTDVGAVYDIRDIGFLALGPTAPVKGHPVWAMRGVQANGRGRLSGLYVNGGYRCGVALKGDHMTIADLNVQGNRFGVELPSGQGSQGDIRLLRVQADGCTQAGLGVAEDVALAGFVWIDGSIGNAPYGVLRYEAGAVTGPPSWIAGGVVFDRVATEYCGNEVICDGVEDGASMTGIWWKGNSIDWGLGVSDREWVYNGESKPKRAAWWNSGPISEVRITDGFPGNSGAGVPSLHGSQLIDIVAEYSGRYVMPKLAGGWKPFEITGTQGSHLSQSRIGSRDGTDGILIKPVLLMAGSVLAGELLTRHANGGVQKYTGSGRVCGVATQDGTAATSSKTLMMLVAGATSDTKVKNTWGSSITGGTYLKPHASGGVQPIGTLAAGEQVVGYFPNTVADGALGGADVYGNAMAV